MLGEVAHSVYLPSQLVFYFQQRLLCSGWQVGDGVFDVCLFFGLGLLSRKGLDYGGRLGV
jgi:hypothetical protein